MSRGDRDSRACQLLYILSLSFIENSLPVAVLVNGILCSPLKRVKKNDCKSHMVIWESIYSIKSGIKGFFSLGKMIFLNVIKISPLRRKQAETEELGYHGDLEGCSQVPTHGYLGQGS